MRGAALTPLLAVAALALAGCGGDDDTKTVTRTVTAPQPTSTTETTPDTTTTEETPTDTDGTTTEEPAPGPTTTEESPSSGITQEDAQEAARSAANDYTGSQYGISGEPGDWNAVCTGEGETFSCAVEFNGGQCAGRLTLTGPNLTAGNQRIGCGE